MNGAASHARLQTSPAGMQDLSTSRSACAAQNASAVVVERGSRRCESRAGRTPDGQTDELAADASRTDVTGGAMRIVKGIRNRTAIASRLSSSRDWHGLRSTSLTRDRCMQRVAALRLLVLMSATAGVVSCYTVPPAERFGEPSKDVPSALMINQSGVGSMPLCAVPGSKRACRAWLYAVDGKQAGYFSLSTRIPAGHHEVVLACETWSAGGVIAGGLQMSYTSYEGPFAANRTYYVRREKRDDVADAWIADSKHGDRSRDFGGNAGAGGGGAAIPLQPLPPMPDDPISQQPAHGDNPANSPPAKDQSPAPQSTPPRGR